MQLIKFQVDLYNKTREDITMNYKHECNYEGFQGDDRFFETFDVREMAEELIASLGGLNFSAFNEKHVVIAVPTIDESGRNIKLFDKQLFLSQKEDAFILRQFLERKTKDAFIDIITESADVRRIVQLQIKVDYLILLHEFEQQEEDSLGEALSENADNIHLKVFRLY